MGHLRSLTFRRALVRYERTVSRHKKGYAQEVYRMNVLGRADFADRPLHDITSVDIARYRDVRLATLNPRTGTPLSPHTVRLELALLSDLFEVARIEWGSCRQNPVTPVRKPRLPKGRERRLFPFEERKLVNAAAKINGQLRAIIILAIETAMRQGEIITLRWEHINLSAGIVHLPDTKNGHPRDVPLSRRARRLLQEYGVHIAGPVFSYTSNGVKSAWRRLMALTGIVGLRFHDLRHEAISRLVELGTLNMLEVAAISGHRTLSMLKRYTHLKAHQLVHKLEGGRTKRLQSVFVPYPAKLETMDADQGTRVIFPDFSGAALTICGPISNTRQMAAYLLKQIALRLREGKRIPPPSRIEEGNPDFWLLIDPLSETPLPQPVG